MPRIYDKAGNELTVGVRVKSDRRGEGVVSRLLTGWGPYVPRLYVRRPEGAHSFLVIAECDRAPDAWRCPDLLRIDSHTPKET